MRPLSILLLGTQMATGGAQKILLDQARWLHQHGHKITVVFFYDRDGLVDVWKESLEVPLHNLDVFRHNSSLLEQGLLFLRGMRRLWTILRRERFDAAITYTHDSNMLGLPLAWLAGVPARIGTHLGAIRGIPKWREVIHAALVNIGCIQTLIAASKGAQQNAIQEGVFPARIVVIPNGAQVFEIDPVDRDKTRRFLGLKENELFLLSVGRLVYEKGHEFLVQAMPEIVAKFPQTRAGICGSGPLHDYLASLISANGLEDQVKLLGQWDDIPHLLAAADIFVLPSRWEGLSIALLEGMIARLPVVATRVEGVDEVIQDNLNGYLVPLEDSKALAEAIMQLLKDPEKRVAMGGAAHARVLQGYTTDYMCEQYLKVVEKRLEHHVY
jgi:glycosyltransferase involved in cell wall biosynthesis